MMQIPPPSPAQISLLSEFFSRRNSNSNSNSNTTTATAKKKKVYCHDRNHPDQIPSLLEARQDLASNSSSKNSVGDDGDKSTGISSSCAPRRPSLFANPEAAMIRYENHCLHPSLLLHEEYCDVSASAPFQTLPVQRPQQLQQQHPRKMARRKSPPLKILRNHGPAFVVAHGAASPCRPTDPERGHGGEQQQQLLLQQQQQHETIDENENPQLPPSSECPLTCFSYRTMEKQYEKDTLRMLERIQKSRSFEQQQQRGFYKNQGKQPRNCRQHGSPSAANRQQSFASFRESAVIRTKDNADTDTGNAKQAIHRHDSGFYIGDDAGNGIETTGLVLDETIHDPNYAHANNDFGVAGETPKDGVDENGPSLFEEEEIFELDL